MSQPFLGQIQPMGFGFAPKGWMQCNGQILPIQQYTALFSLLGTMYGGNGTTNFGLPGLQSRVPNHFGTAPYGETFVQGEMAGVEQVQLNSSNMPMHNHNFLGTSQTANDSKPSAGGALATLDQGSHAVTPLYGPPSPTQPLNPASLAPMGGNLPHPNVQPYQAVNWCIAFVGVYPSRS